MGRVRTHRVPSLRVVSHAVQRVTSGHSEILGKSPSIRAHREKSQVTSVEPGNNNDRRMSPLIGRAREMS